MIAREIDKVKDFDCRFCKRNLCALKVWRAMKRCGIWQTTNKWRLIMRMVVRPVEKKESRMGEGEKKARRRRRWSKGDRVSKDWERKSVAWPTGSEKSRSKWKQFMNQQIESTGVAANENKTGRKWRKTSTKGRGEVPRRNCETGHETMIVTTMQMKHRCLGKFNKKKVNSIV